MGADLPDGWHHSDEASRYDTSDPDNQRDAQIAQEIADDRERFGDKVTEILDLWADLAPHPSEQDRAVALVKAGWRRG